MGEGGCERVGKEKWFLVTKSKLITQLKVIHKNIRLVLFINQICNSLTNAQTFLARKNDRGRSYLQKWSMSLLNLHKIYK